jgi:hypothetical protein
MPRRNPSSVFMGSTNIPVSRTIAEVQSLLVQVGAQQIAQDYDKQGAIVGMIFTLPVGSSILCFDLPVRSQQVFEKVHSQRKRQKEQHESEDRVTANRIAWRQLLRWIEAQLAMVDVGMVQAHEVLMPYAIDRSGRTMFHLWSSQLALPVPDSEE